MSAQMEKPAQDMLRQVGANNARFVDWLEVERDSALAILKFNTIPATFHQAQGKVQFLDQLLRLLGGTRK